MPENLVFLLAGAAFLANAAAPSVPKQETPLSPAVKRLQLEPPPGWEDAGATIVHPHVRAMLRGPEDSSFVLVHVAPMSLDNRGKVRQYLAEAIDAAAKKTGEPYQAAGALQSSTYDNGVTVHHIRAQVKGKPRMAVGLLEFNGETLFATLSSAVPDTMLPSILGSLRGRVAAADVGGKAVSTDRQFQISLPAGVVSRGLVERERRQGFVLALRGYGAELMVMKLSDPSAVNAKEQPAIVKDTVLSFDGVDAKTLSSPALIATIAGPSAVHAAAKLGEGAGGGEFAAGYLPWCYWGYSFLAKGPQGGRLLAESLSKLDAGPSALPKLVAQTPEIPLGRRPLPKLPRGWAGPAAILAAIGLAFWIARRRM